MMKKINFTLYIFIFCVSFSYAQDIDSLKNNESIKNVDFIDSSKNNILITIIPVIAKIGNDNLGYNSGIEVKKNIGRFNTTGYYDISFVDNYSTLVHDINANKLKQNWSWNAELSYVFSKQNKAKIYNTNTLTVKDFLNSYQNVSTSNVPNNFKIHSFKLGCNGSLENINYADRLKKNHTVAKVIDELDEVVYLKEDIELIGTSNQLRFHTGFETIGIKNIPNLKTPFFYTASFEVIALLSEKIGNEFYDNSSIYYKLTDTQKAFYINKVGWQTTYEFRIGCFFTKILFGKTTGTGGFMLNIGSGLSFNL